MAIRGRDRAASASGYHGLEAVAAIAGADHRHRVPAAVTGDDRRCPRTPASDPIATRSGRGRALGAASFASGARCFFQAALAVLMARPLLTGSDASTSHPSKPAARIVPVGLFTLALGIYTAVNAAGNLRAVSVEGKAIPGSQTGPAATRGPARGARAHMVRLGSTPSGICHPRHPRVDGRTTRDRLQRARVNEDHQRFYAVRANHARLPRSHRRRPRWLPSRLKVSDALIANGWIKVLDTGQSVVLSRKRPAYSVAISSSGVEQLPCPKC